MLNLSDMKRICMFMEMLNDKKFTNYVYTGLDDGFLLNVEFKDDRYIELKELFEAWRLISSDLIDSFCFSITEEDFGVFSLRFSMKDGKNGFPF